MSKKQKDYSTPTLGEKFHYLTFQKAYLKDFGSYKKTVAICRCDCGEQTEVNLSQLRKGKVRSCGCYHKKRASESNQTHGKSRGALYRLWCAMKRRCSNPTTNGTIG